MALKSELEENPFEPPIDEDFLKAALEYRDRFEDDEEFQEALAVWPRCPQCGRRRVARCPICKTSGTLFPLGDSDFWDFRSAEERANDAALFDASEERACACGRSCGKRRRDASFLYDESEPAPSCLEGEIQPGVKDWRHRSTNEKTSDVFDNLTERRRRDRSWAQVGRRRSNVPYRGSNGAALVSNGGENRDSTPIRSDASDATSSFLAPELVVCYVCSEAFVPQFSRRCEWCDFDFGVGADPDVAPADATTVAEIDEFVARKAAEDAENSDPDVLSPRVLGTLVALGLGALAALIYFAITLR